MFGKVKTCLQIATILAVIAVHGDPLWVSALLYVTVVVTVLSGLDYFFGMRRRMQARQRKLRPRRLRARRRASSHYSRLVWRATGAPESISARSSASRP